ncbi:ABC transporter substrate-binding protein [Maridesulfovibrio bastinii]|uniref:ABC transporter substrate-binding protein n=1 Tax=Maridesulfovibrio bastinii TaxID=47157 RepID=UPI000419EA59|nr:ABC transporter substrate-binding protein [Maridesulfovibrio bastinii]
MLDKKRITNAFYVALTVLMILSQAAIGSAGTVIDMTGRTVDIPDSVSRVYAVSPPETMMVYAIDPKLLIGLNFPFKGCDKYVDAATLKLPIVGGYFGQGKIPNYEKLVSLKPDLVIGRKSNPMSAKFEAMLAKFNIPVFNISIDDIDEYAEGFETLGMVFDRMDRAEKLAEYTRKTLEETKTVVDSIPADNVVKVYYAEGNDGLRTDSSTSIHAKLIPLAGGDNVFKGDIMTRFGKEKVTLETVISYHPDVILVERPQFFKKIYSLSAWKNIPAVKNHRVFLIPRKPFNWFDRPPSFMRILGLKWVSSKLYPDLFKLDMTKECQNFFHLFLQKDISAAEAEKLMSGMK